MNLTPDWYFYCLLLLLVIFIWIKMIYPKFLIDFFYAALSYPFANKVYYESGISRKYAGQGMNLIYFISGSLFIFNIVKHYNIQLFDLPDINILIFSVLILVSLILFRIFCLKFVAFIFHKEKIINLFIFHFYIYNKLLGLFLIPFLLFIPYTEGFLQTAFLYISFVIISIVFIYRLIRVIMYIFKNDIFIFYLFLYLCVFEILPYLVILKFLISLDEGS